MEDESNMDRDSAVEPKLDTFSLILPLPYRIAVIFVLGEYAAIAKPRMRLIDTQVFGHGARIFTTSPLSRLYVLVYKSHCASK